MRRRKIGRLAARAVEMAEEVFPEPGAGAKKRKWVVEFLNDKINIPGIGEGMEERMLALLVDVVVDLVINKSR